MIPALIFVAFMGLGAQQYNVPFSPRSSAETFRYLHIPGGSTYVESSTNKSLHMPGGGTYRETQ